MSDSSGATSTPRFRLQFRCRHAQYLPCNPFARNPFACYTFACPIAQRLPMLPMLPVLLRLMLSMADVIAAASEIVFLFVLPF